MIVLISGLQGSGKSSVQQALQKAARDRFKHVLTRNFADPLYVFHEFILNKMEGTYGVPKPASNKDGVLLQVLGTEWGRKVHGEDVWVNIMKNVVNNFGQPNDTLFIIADCRFENEFHKFPEALRVRLHCNEPERKLRTHAWRENTTHASETNLDALHNGNKFDLYIDMSGKNISVDGAVSLILAQLDKDTWMEKRK